MASLKLTLQNLRKMKTQFTNAEHSFGPSARDTSGWLKETTGFGENPGQLRMFSHVPPGAGADSPLVVVLHGCTQTAAGYADHAGWRELAERYHFRLLCPQQTPQNNSNGCFNWFVPIDIAREGGECHSIYSMIRYLSGGTTDTPQVYVTGLSAGGAMACAMMAAYPEIFTGGSIIAGLPYGSAADVPSAFAAMHQPKSVSAKVLGERVRNASSHVGPWPRITVWHGRADKTVVPANADELCKQWLDVHGVHQRVEHTSDAQTDWRNAAGTIVVSRRMVQGMAHGAPVDSRGPEACGSVAPFILEAGISSSLVMARDWGLAHAVFEGEVLAPEKPQVTALHAGLSAMPDQVPAASAFEQRNNQRNVFIQNTINAALKSAGLIRS